MLGSAKSRAGGLGRLGYIGARRTVRWHRQLMCAACFSMTIRHERVKWLRLTPADVRGWAGSRLGGVSVLVAYRRDFTPPNLALTYISIINC
jgi:hypothetical protein